MATRQLSDREAYELRRNARVAMTPPSDLELAGAEEYAPGDAGEARTIVVNGEALAYRVIDGLAIFGGDIILGYADEGTARVHG